jgi:hypothetical protein
MNLEQINALIKKLDGDKKPRETAEPRGQTNILPFSIRPSMVVPNYPVCKSYEPLFNLPEIPELDPSILEDMEKLSESYLIRSHKSELLSIMNQAIDELWENHDYKNPPTTEVVKAWFKEKGYDRSNIEMEAIDKIMRPDRYKGGKNRV